MSQKINRRNVGLWFVGILGLIFTAIAIWYAKYTDWWTKWVTRDQQTLQTINTGANVLVSTMSSPTTGPTVQPPTVTPSPTSPPPTTGSDSFRRPQMW